MEEKVEKSEMQSGECCTCSEENCSMSSIADEKEVLRTLTRILRREETEDAVVKLREETRTTEEDGKTYVERGERVEVVKLRPKLADVEKAAELLGKHHGIFSERIEGSIALPLIICGEDELS